ncbi:MAG: DMT family transporter [Bacillota bacterium]|nr:DMT family transporter [Bacillota bacterium]
MRKTDIYVFSLLVATYVIWSNSFIAISYLRQSVSSLDIVMLRFIPVGLISLVVVAAKYRREFIEIVKKHPVRLAAMGLTNVIIYNLLTAYGLTYINASAGSLLIALNPLFTMLLAARFLRESLTKSRVIGTVLSFIGLIIVVVFGKVGLEESTFIPLDKVHYALMVILATLSWAVYTILIKPLMSSYSPQGLNYMILLVGSAPLFLGINRRFINVVANLDAMQIFSVFFLAVMCTVVGYSLWLTAVKYWTASNVSLFAFLNPPLTAVFSYIYFGKGISPLFFIGGVIMLAGIIIATNQKIAERIKGKPVVIE